MSPKATSPAPPAPSAPPTAATISGKWLIIGIFGLALAGAGGSWWFRYSSTHRAAEFWGSEAARLIRDAPTVTFSTFETPVDRQARKFEGPALAGYLEAPQVVRNVTSAKGLVHLRNALLEDHSFDWPSQLPSPFLKSEHALTFSDDKTARKVYILFSQDPKVVTLVDSNSSLSYEPIAAGIAEMFAEFESLPAIEPATPAR